MLEPPLTGAAPRLSSERILCLDVLRGVALLGILVINVRFFALPLLRWNDAAPPGHPLRLGDVLAWGLGQVFFEHEMIALFSMLFGAGLVLMSDRLEHSGIAPARLHYRRMLWLLVIGHAHAFLLWYGDILMAYAVCGALLFPLRRLPPALLALLGVAALSMAPAIRAAPTLVPSALPAGPDARAASSIEAQWQKLAAQERYARHHGSITLLRWRARVNVLWHYQGFHRFTGWLAGGFMLLGMALLRWRVLTGERSRGFYLNLALLGYAAGLPLVLAGVQPQLFEAVRGAGGAAELLARWVGPSPLPPVWHQPLRFFGGALLALGHLGVVVALLQAGVLGRAGNALAAVGRMTLTAYLLQSALCVLLFEGLGLWSRLGHAALLGVVACVCAFELALCSVWLRRFRLGPVEWLWRSLTYGRMQQLRLG